MPVMTNLCDCSTNGLKFWSPCTPQIGAGCIQTFKCSLDPAYDPCGNIIGCTTFDNVAIERRIQNQSRMPASQFKDALEDVTVAQDLLHFQGSSENFISMSSRVWGNPNYLRNQSDRSTPSRSGAWTGYGDRNPRFGMSVGGAKINISGYVNVPTRGNSTRSTITGNRPGAMTPGGQGVDVKHGSYDRYLSKKKGAILSRPKVIVTDGDGSEVVFDILKTSANGIANVVVKNKGKNYNYKPTLKVIESDVRVYAASTSIGVTKRDMNCERMKLSKLLYDFNMKVAAVSVMCQDRRVFDAMMHAGTPCPYDGMIGEAAKAAWIEEGKMEEEEGFLDDQDTQTAAASGGLAGLLLLLLL